MHQTEPGLLDPRIALRRSTLADGRELIYYDDADSVLPAERAIDARTLDPRPGTAEMRQDPLTGGRLRGCAKQGGRVAGTPNKSQRAVLEAAVRGKSLKAAVAALVGLLAHRDARVRLKAATVLVRAAGPARTGVVPKLLAELRRLARDGPR